MGVAIAATAVGGREQTWRTSDRCYLLMKAYLRQELVCSHSQTLQVLIEDKVGAAQLQTLSQAVICRAIVSAPTEQRARLSKQRRERMGQSSDTEDR